MEELLTVNKTHTATHTRPLTDTDLLRSHPCQHYLKSLLVTRQEVTSWLLHFLKPFFDYRDELTAQDGLILGEQWIVIHATWNEEKAHAGHLCINTFLKRRSNLQVRHDKKIGESLCHLYDICRSPARIAKNYNSNVRKAMATSHGGSPEYLVMVDTHNNFLR